MTLVLGLFSDWKALLRSRNTSTDEDFLRMDSDLSLRTTDLDKQVKQLQKVVAKIDKNRAQFPHIDDAELRGRKKYCSEARDIVRSVKQTLSSADTRAKLNADKQVALKGRRALGSDEDAGYATQSQTPAREAFQETQRQAHAQQNEVLDDMMASVHRLGVMGEMVGDELGAQSRMLVDLDEELDEVGSRMHLAQKKLEKLLQTKSCWKLWTVLFLTVVLAILLFIIISL